MTVDARNLSRKQRLKVNLNKVKDRLPKALINKLKEVPYGELIGFKMVDGNQFGLVLKLDFGSTQWFFEDELSEIIED